MAKKPTRKTGKRTATKNNVKPRSATRKQPAKKKTSGATKRATARKPAAANTSGSGLVYTDLLREALAARTR